MSRALWFVAGAVSGVYTLVKAKRTAQNFTPDGLGARMAAVGLGARMFADEVVAGMSVREAELRSELRLSPSPRPALEEPSHRAVDPLAVAPALATDAAAPHLPTQPDNREGIDDGDR